MIAHGRRLSISTCIRFVTSYRACLRTCRARRACREVIGTVKGAFVFVMTPLRAIVVPVTFLPVDARALVGLRERRPVISTSSIRQNVPSSIPRNSVGIPSLSLCRIVPGKVCAPAGLAVKGPLRRANSARPLDCSGRLGRTYLIRGKGDVGSVPSTPTCRHPPADRSREASALMDTSRCRSVSIQDFL